MMHFHEDTARPSVLPTVAKAAFVVVLLTTLSWVLYTSHQLLKVH